MERVVVGLSGGVDSSVAAYLLKNQGYEVIGLFMKNWNDSSVTIDDECPWIDDSNDAMLVAEMLGIAFHVVDLSKEYEQRIVNYMFDEYESGRTPNPDILCNREIKFDVFLEKALALDADYIATGHYCQKDTIQRNGITTHRLLAGADNQKDQSYFLCQISQKQLAKAIFPIGHLTKPEVRKLAQENKLVTANKKDSQGLCFVGKVRLPEFLQQKLKPKEGVIVLIPEEGKSEKKINKDTSETELEKAAQKINYQLTDGKEIGNHQGAHYFTVGQRKGLAVGGTKEPLFVLSTDVKTNVIYVGEGKNHPDLYRDTLYVKKDEVHWLREEYSLKENEQLSVIARIRYRQPLEEATLFAKKKGLYVVFKKPQKAIAEGQFVAWYIGDELIGSGTIS